MASAPTWDVARRDVVAVEHPMVVKDLDKALKTFGVGAETTGQPFRRVSIHGHVFRFILESAWKGRSLPFFLHSLGVIRDVNK